MKLIALGFFLFLGSLATATAQDQLGTIQAAPVKCVGGVVKPTACYSLDITCPKLPDYTAYIKIVAPTRQSFGTVLFTSGGDVNSLYEAYTYGQNVIRSVVSSRLTAVELTFGDPFSQGPGWEYDANGAGVRAASCRYATVVQWVYDNLTNNNVLCATGNSAGGQVIGEGLAHYGISKYLVFAEMTSGPPFNRVDYACLNNVAPAVEYCSNISVRMGVGITNAEDYVDPAYPGPWCSSDLQNHAKNASQQFLDDSVTSPDADLFYPFTRIRFLFGGLDTSSAIRQGLNYQSKILSSTSYGCVADAPHSIPEVLDGAQAIASDLVANCHR
jgi:hypothetical protein